METLIIVSQFLLSLTILVFLHELGHFAPSKWFGARVEKFYIFFDAWFSVFKFKKGETEYGIGWLPLGGYVKIAGMVDESFDREQLKKDPQPWEFRSKPAWQRLIIMLGGVTVNFILGFLLFALLFWWYGESYIPSRELKDGIAVEEQGRALGLQDGDQILKIGDKTFDRFNPKLLNLEIGLNNVRTISVLRDGKEQLIQVPEEATQGLLSNENKNMEIIVPRFPFVIAAIPDGSPSKDAGLMPEDQVIGLDGEPIQYYNEFSRAIKSKASSVVQIDVKRGNDTLQFAVKTTEDAKIVVQPFGYPHFFELEKQRYGLIQAIPAGINKGVTFIGNQIKAFGQIFTGKTKASESLGGFVSIAKLFPSKWNWEAFWSMTAVLSLVLGFMNLLPIPGLDGGHVFFLFVEMITGRKVSDKIVEKATMVGFILLISLLLYANGLDVMRLFNKG